jgi:hypothetical protein
MGEGVRGAGDPRRDPSCDLCEAARLTDWYYEDDVCWIAECEACFVPMVVWKQHDPNPPQEIRAVLFECLSDVAGRVLASEFWIDDHLRSIPDHYHAHARRRPSRV